MAGLGDYVKDGVEDLKRNAVTLIIAEIVGGIVAGVTLGILAGPMVVAFNEMLLRGRKGEQLAVGDMFRRIDKDAILTAIIPIAGIVAVMIVMGILTAVTNTAMLPWQPGAPGCRPSAKARWAMRSARNWPWRAGSPTTLVQISRSQRAS